MTLNLLGCVRLNSLGVPIGDAMGDSNASASAVASPKTALDSPSPVAVVMRRRRAKCSANQKRRAGSGHARHNQTLEHGERKVSENYGGRIIVKCNFLVKVYHSKMVFFVVKMMGCRRQYSTVIFFLHKVCVVNGGNRLSPILGTSGHRHETLGSYCNSLYPSCSPFGFSEGLKCNPAKA